MGWHKDAAYAALLGRTYRHSVTAHRPGLDGETLVCQDLPCGLSRSAHTSAPAPAEGGGALSESAYRYALYTAPEITFRLGDRLEVSDGTCVYRGRASDSFRYPGHCVTVFEVLEVTEA